MLFTAEASSDTSSTKGKKLIEFGWDEPSTGFLRAHIAQMQQSPFDGCVFHVQYSNPKGEQGSFTWEGWGTKPFNQNDLQAAFKDLKVIHFGTFDHCFLRFNTTPGKLDWFDDYSAVISNACLAAQLARAGKCPGILFDTEQYEGPLFEYHKQRDAKSKSWELYAAQARLRGAEVIRAFQQGYPGLTLFLTFGYSLPWSESSAGKKALAECHYGLLGPFLDGMVEATQGRTRIVDGHELSYAYKTAAQFSAARKAATVDLLPIVRDSEKYRRVFSIGFGLWMDYDSHKLAWETENVAKNFFPPEVFQASVHEAMKTADEYVWIYTEIPRWWSDSGKAIKLPEAYADAVRKARK
ncbi:MAG: hypothetical protein C5B50_10880 [Verrucomicrobia bacterium]|nr:MAG: hypothetical protein C5B50_10880 [Verrucomicrobiota bacterium]